MADNNLSTNGESTAMEEELQNGLDDENDNEAVESGADLAKIPSPENSVEPEDNPEAEEDLDTEDDPEPEDNPEAEEDLDTEENSEPEDNPESEEDLDTDDNPEPEDDSKKNSKKKVIILGGITLGILVLLATGGILLFSGDGGEKKLTKGAIAIPDGYIASLPIPPRKRKRMKTGLELSRERTSTDNSTPADFSTSTKPEQQINAAFESADKTEPKPSSSNSVDTKLLTARVIGARMVPGKGLIMPSVTAAAYNSIPLKQKSEAVAAPDESLMETVNDRVVPKLSSTGKGSWQTYNHKFTPTLQQIRTGEGEEIKSIPFARVSIIIRGVGLNRNATLAAINKLPAEVSLAFSPYAKGMEEWASLARGAGHETLMSLPMEPKDFPALDPGPLSLLTDLKSEENISRLHAIMNLSQAYIGLVQHMGSRFVTSEAALKPIIKVLKDRGLMFIDDGLVSNSLGTRLAAEISLPHARIDMVIDDDASGVKIAQNLQMLEQIALKAQSGIGLAKKNNSALGIGEAYPATIMQIQRWAKTLKGKMIDLAPVSAVIRDTFQQPTTSATKEN